MKKVLFLMSLAAIFVACGGTQTKENSESAELNVDQIMEKADAYVGKTITAVGVIDHVCAHGGGKMFMVNDEGTNKLKIVPSGELQAFTPEMEGSTLIVTGTLEEMRITNEYLDNWGKEAKVEKADDAELTEEEAEISNDETPVKEEGHHHSAHGENADMGEHKTDSAQIEIYRAEIAASEKGYLSIFTLNATKIEKKEASEE